ncbi:hypothetical protein F2P81_026046 [Scophthalmus maximus]|uniref:Uncharacterized protein n=1 Tax=Scophthalmus maximus TaxID=52904 RepID=A0A6A4RR33_SCOMX|nr:hypothetical protein F2P81_026046 [Scophthalmus maximus]
MEEAEETEEQEKHNEENGSDVTEAERGDEEGERNEHTASDEDITVSEGIYIFGLLSQGQELPKQTPAQHYRAPVWVPHVISSLSKDIYHYAGQDILIYESMDSFGAVMWPGALALCSFLDHNRETVNLQGKQVLELGAGTGLVAIVASLLGEPSQRSP